MVPPCPFPLFTPLTLHQYNTDKESGQDESQKNLSKWGEEEWQTKEGSGNAKKEDGTQQRYLPKKAWENMTEEEKKATEEEKQKGSKEGKQHVGNTERAKEERQKANEEEAEKYEGKSKGRGKGGKQGGKKEEEDKDEGGKEDKDDEEDDGKAKRGTKRKANESKKEEDEPEKSRRTTRSSTKANGEKNGEKKDEEKSKSHAVDGKSTYGSKKQSPNAPHPQGGKDRLPKKGQKVTWKAMPGWVEGEVIEVVKSKKTVEGKEVKGSENDPRIVLRSHGPSGKVAVHKADAVFFE